MISIICGTNRPEARSLEICLIVEKKLKAQGEECRIVDLKDLPLTAMTGSYGSDSSPELKEMVNGLNSSRGYVIVAPEYNGSMPGILKYFIDHWDYPVSFEKVPVCFIGLGGRYGGVRPIEHLQQVFNYRNAFCYPVRVFIFNVWNELKEGALSEAYDELIKDQLLGFGRFLKALEGSGLYPSRGQETSADS